MEDVSGTILLGFGLLALMIGIASFSIQMTIKKSARSQTPSDAEQFASKERPQAIAEAIRRDPSLASATSPGDLARLDALAREVQHEWQVRRDLEEAQQAQRAHAEREEWNRTLKAQREQDLQRRKARLAAMRPVPRWIVTHQAIVAMTAVVIGVGLILAVGNVIESRRSAAEVRQQEAREAEVLAAEAEFRAALIASCDFSRRTEMEPADLGEWTDCDDPRVRKYAVTNAAGLTVEDQKRLVDDPDDGVRRVLAERTMLAPEIQSALSQDWLNWVRRSLAKNPGLTSSEAIDKLSRDADPLVKEYLRGNPAAARAASSNGDQSSGASE